MNEKRLGSTSCVLVLVNPSIIKTLAMYYSVCVRARVCFGVCLFVGMYAWMRVSVDFQSFEMMVKQVEIIQSMVVKQASQ